MAKAISRRHFTMGAMGAGLAAPRRTRADRIRLGFVGVANRGSQLLDAALVNDDIEVVGLCDVHAAARDKWKARLPKAETNGDFRKMLQRKDLDAVFVA